MQATMDRLALIDTRLKIRLLVFLGFVLMPFGMLVLVNVADMRTVNALLVMLSVGMIVLFAPISSLINHLVVQRNIREINEYCQRIKQGEFQAMGSLPPERGEEHDFLRLKRNLHWMAHALGMREQRLSKTLASLDAAQREILSSIQYASLIQRSFLPHPTALNDCFKDHFLWWQPRDVVGGDAYWVKRAAGGHFVGVIDCTGHGVPGAFMTLIVVALLERLDLESMAGNPGLVLEVMNRNIKQTLRKASTDDAANETSDDGMDCGMIWIGPERQIVFAGARIGLLVVEQGEVREIKGERAGVGYLRTPDDVRFANVDVGATAEATFYLHTDGLVDQVGGDKRFPFGRKRLHVLLHGAQGRPLQGQRRMLESAFEDYRGGEARRDDVTALGFTI